MKYVIPPISWHFFVKLNDCNTKEKLHVSKWIKHNISIVCYFTLGALYVVTIYIIEVSRYF